MEKTITDKIKHRIKVLPRGSVVVTSDFTHLASDNTVRQIFYRLTKEDKLITLGKGLYKKKNFNELFGQEVPVDPQLIATAYARKMNWIIYPSKNLALHSLGLSTQVPNVYTYNSNGPTTRVSFEGRELAFQHVNPRNISSQIKSNLIIEAINYLGKDSVKDEELKILSGKLTKKEYQQLKKDSQRSSEWIKNNIRKMEKYL
mgnify:CR=1 FL=1